MTKREQHKKIAQITKLFQTALPRWRTKYASIIEGYNFLAGKQYTQSQIKYYEAQRRPVDVFNLTLPLFNQALGDFLLNQEAIQVRRGLGGNPETAMILQQYIDDINTNNLNDSKHFLSELGLAGINQIGWIYPRYSSEVKVDGSVVIGNVDEMEVMFDPEAQDYFIRDGWIMRSRWVKAEDLIAKWPHRKKELKEMIVDFDKFEVHEDYSEQDLDNMRDLEMRDIKNGKYRVVEFHELIQEAGTVAIDTVTGESDYFNNMHGKKRELYMLKTNPTRKFIEKDTVPISRVTEVVPGLGVYLDQYYPTVQDGMHQLLPFFAYNYGQRAIDHFGVMQNSLGPQKNFNNWKNQSQHILNKTAKTSRALKKESIENFAEIRKHGDEPGVDYIIDKNAKIADAVHHFDPPKFPFATEQMSNEAEELLMKITGIRSNQMGGQETSQENASLFRQRVNQAKTALEVIYENFRKTKRALYRKSIKLAQTNITDERTLFFVNSQTLEDSQVTVNQRMGDSIVNDITTGEYQVYVDTAERNPTARALRFMQKSELVTQLILPNLGPAAVDWRWLLEDSDLGDIETLIERIEAQLQQMAQSSSEQEAIAATDGLINLAKNRLALSDAGLPQQAAR